MPFQKGNDYGSRKGRHKNTIEREEQRAAFNRAVDRKWKKIIDNEMQEAINDFKVRHYVIDQRIGKATESKEVKIGGGAKVIVIET